MRLPTLLVVVLLILAGCGSDGAAPGAPGSAAPDVSAAEVFGALAEAEQVRLDGVENFATVTEVEGSLAAMFERIVAFYERGEDGAFTTRSQVQGGLVEQMAAFGGTSTADESPGVINPASLASRLQADYAERASYVGEETIDGARTLAFRIEGARDLFEETEGLTGAEDAPAPSGPDSTVATIYVDPAANVIRRMVMDDVQDVEGTARAVQVVISLGDYREVGSMLLPYRSEIRSNNPLTAEEQADVRQELEAQRGQMDQMPPPMRTLMEGSLAMAEALASGEDLVMTMTVTEATVNEGPPEGLDE